MKDALAKYILFSGGGAMPPMWGLGYHYRVKSEYTQNEAEKLIDEFREMEMPCDMLGLEPGWQTKAYSCSFLWENNRFENPEQFVKNMKEKGVQISLWQHAFTHPESEMYNALKEYSSDFEVWEGLVPDFATKARDIFGNYQKEKLLDMGITAVKLDECDSSDYTGGWSFPEFAEFPSGMDGEQYHAAFGMLYQKSLLDGFDKINKRTWSMVRSTNALNSQMPFVLYSDLYDHNDFIRGLASAPLSGMMWSPEVRQCASVNDLIRRTQTT
ncbi:MAG: glycoside hydrolase family 31 protein, partial [Oscillospiraceae bacterium]